MTWYWWILSYTAIAFLTTFIAHLTDPLEYYDKEDEKHIAAGALWPLTIALLFLLAVGSLWRRAPRLAAEKARSLHRDYRSHREAKKREELAAAGSLSYPKGEGGEVSVHSYGGNTNSE